MAAMVALVALWALISTGVAIAHLFRRPAPPLTREDLAAAINAALDAHDAQITAAVRGLQPPALADRNAAASVEPSSAPSLPAPAAPSSREAVMLPVPPNGHSPDLLLSAFDELHDALVAETAADSGPAAQATPGQPAETRVARQRALLQRENDKRAAAADARRQKVTEDLVAVFRARGQPAAVGELAKVLNCSKTYVKDVLLDKHKDLFVVVKGKWGLREWLAPAQ